MGAMTERSAHASQAAVVLDIGGDVGALVLYTGAEGDEAENDISPGTHPAAPRPPHQGHSPRAPPPAPASAPSPRRWPRARTPSGGMSTRRKPRSPSGVAR